MILHTGYLNLHSPTAAEHDVNQNVQREEMAKMEQIYQGYAYAANIHRVNAMRQIEEGSSYEIVAKSLYQISGIWHKLVHTFAKEQSKYEYENKEVYCDRSLARQARKFMKHAWNNEISARQHEIKALESVRNNLVQDMTLALPQHDIPKTVRDNWAHIFEIINNWEDNVNEMKHVLNISPKCHMINVQIRRNARHATVENMKDIIWFDTYPMIDSLKEAVNAVTDLELLSKRPYHCEWYMDLYDGLKNIKY